MSVPAAMRGLVAIVLSLTLPLPCAAQAEAPVAKPDVKVGDRWTYRRMDYAKNTPGESYELVVTFAGPRAIQAVVTGPGARESDVTYTPEWNDVVSPSGVVNVREKGELQFPLHVGATYRIAWELENPQQNTGSGRHERTVKVVGWEEISVPAGRFRALKVVSEGTHRAFLTYSMTPPGNVKDTFWYVPEVKRWVKHLQESATPNLGSRGAFEYRTTGEELVGFKVQ